MRWNEEGAWPLSRKDGSFSGVVSATRKRSGDERKNRCESSDQPPQTGRKLARRLATARRSACSSFRKPAAR